MKTNPSCPMGPSVARELLNGLRVRGGASPSSSTVARCSFVAAALIVMLSSTQEILHCL